MTSLEEKKAARFKILYWIYKLTDGDTHKDVYLKIVAADLGLDEGLTYRAGDYLK